MATARWNGVVLAESDHCHIVEGNYYFPPESVHREYLKPSRARSLCFWKGLASYYHIEVDGARNQDAAWYYPAPSWFARRIKNYVAFWNRVEVEPQRGTHPSSACCRVEMKHEWKQVYPRWLEYRFTRGTAPTGMTAIEEFTRCLSRNTGRGLAAG